MGVWWGQIGGFLRKNPILGWENLGFGEVSRADWGLSEEKPNSGMGNFGVCWGQQSKFRGFQGKNPTHVKSASREDTKIHSSSGRPSPSATTFSMALPTKPVPPVTRMRLVTSVMAKTLQGGARGTSWDHLRVDHPGVGTHEHRPRPGQVGSGFWGGIFPHFWQKGKWKKGRVWM